MRISSKKRRKEREWKAKFLLATWTLSQNFSSPYWVLLQNWLRVNFCNKINIYRHIYGSYVGRGLLFYVLGGQPSSPKGSAMLAGLQANPSPLTGCASQGDGPLKLRDNHVANFAGGGGGGGGGARASYEMCKILFPFNN